MRWLYEVEAEAEADDYYSVDEKKAGRPGTSKFEVDREASEQILDPARISKWLSQLYDWNSIV